MDSEPIKAIVSEGLSAYNPIQTGNETFPKILVRKEQPSSGEPTVRVYRGVTDLSAEVIDNQMCYAARKDIGGGKFEIDERLEPLAKNLAEEPNYDNLTSYLDEKSKGVTFEQTEKMSKRLWEIEDDILDGKNVRQILILDQVSHPGGTSVDTGIAPYISATSNLSEAVSWVRIEGGILVIDIPLSKLEGADKSESAIKFKIEPCEIKAIIPADSINEKATAEDLVEVNQQIDQNLGGQQEQSLSLWQQQEEIKKRVDAEVWKNDVEKVKTRRVGYLSEKFPEAKVDISDDYKTAKQKVKNNLIERIKLFGGSSEEYEWVSSESGKPEEFVLLENKKLIEKSEVRKLPEVAGILGIPSYSTPEEIMTKRNEIFTAAEQLGIKVSREDFTRSQMRRVVEAVKH